VASNVALNAILILIVDDNSGFRVMLCKFLQAHGFRTAECASGKEAIGAYRQLHPDVVLMDLRMEPMNGLAATKRIVELDTAAKVVILTSYDDPSLREAAYKAGALGYSSKEDLAGLLALLAF